MKLFIVVGLLVLGFATVSVWSIRRLDRSCDTVAFHLHMFQRQAVQQPSNELLEQMRAFYWKRARDMTPAETEHWRSITYFVERNLHYKKVSKV